MLQPVKNLDEYKRVKDTLRQRFDTDRLGEQNLFNEQSQILQPLIKPLIATQAQTVKAIEANAARSSPGQRTQQPSAIVGELFRPALTMSPLQEEETSPIKIDLDSGFDEIDIRNLQDMGFELPSEVFKKKQIERTIAKIKTENRSIGQKLGKGSDATEEEKAVYGSWKKTLEIYRQKIQGLEGAKQFVGKGAAPARGLLKAATPDVIFYPSVEDLCIRLAEFTAAKQAGNTGLDNTIISVLDELLKTQAISKDAYDDLYKIIFL